MWFVLIAVNDDSPDQSVSFYVFNHIIHAEEKGRFPNFARSMTLHVFMFYVIQCYFLFGAKVE